MGLAFYEWTQPSGHQNRDVSRTMSNTATETPQRRLADTIIKAFYQACDARNPVAANHLVLALESVFKHEAEHYPEDRRAFVDTLSELRMHLLLAA
jgi:hypothetical protein